MDPPSYSNEAPPSSSINIKSSFVSQDALDESRARREEEWKRAHANADHPPPMPEEPYDPRTLYERLKEQRDRKEAEFEEATRFGNLVHRLDNEEAHFLDEMTEDRRKKERALEAEEAAALERFRSELTGARDTSLSPSSKVKEEKKGEGPLSDPPRKRRRSKEHAKSEDLWGVKARRKETKLSRMVVVKKSDASSPSPPPPPPGSSSHLEKEKKNLEDERKDKGLKDERGGGGAKPTGLVAYDSDEDSD